ncbi:unnamed protein product, partial [Sphacelaria rigidula]
CHINKRTAESSLVAVETMSWVLLEVIQPIGYCSASVFCVYHSVAVAGAASRTIFLLCEGGRQASARLRHAFANRLYVRGIGGLMPVETNGKSANRGCFQVSEQECA